MIYTGQGNKWDMIYHDHCLWYQIYVLNVQCNSAVKFIVENSCSETIGTDLCKIKNERLRNEP